MMSKTLSAVDLQQLSTRELLDVFANLEAPCVAEMQGEYAARLLAQPFRLAAVIGRTALENPLQPWLSKAFRQIDDVSGRGYNTFLQAGHIVQRFPMRTLMAPSRFDGLTAYQLVYRHFHSACGAIHMVDEVRRAAPGLYLGMGTYGFTDGQRRIPYPFLLEGPVAAYRGDIGRERKRFCIGPREIPALFTS
jgi:hypothetical protein